MNVRVLFFAQARDLAKTSEVTLDVEPGASVRDLRALLVDRYGAPLGTFGLARNERWAEGHEELGEGDEVAVLPPVSGGAGGSSITRRPLDPQGAIDAVSHHGAGAVVVFLGTVRNTFEGQPTLALEYEAYEAMAEKELDAVVSRAASDFGARVAATHRLGRLNLGETSVVIAASAPHRKEAFDACRQVIEDIKVRVPIWKREIRPSGASWHDSLEDPSGD